MKTALIYNPYFDTLGGGERYTIEIARVLSKDYKVYIAWNDKKLLEKCTERFGMDFVNISIETKAHNIIKKGSIFDKRKLMRDFDLAFFVSDGSLPFMFAKKNFLHFQVPFHDYRLKPLDLLKFKQYKKIIVNSKFTEKFVQKSYKTINTRILFPPVTQMENGKKRNIILNVGRFGSPTHPKKQEVLIKAFLKLPKTIRKDWSLILAGGYRDEEAYLEKLSKLSGRENILVITNPSFEQIKELYREAAIYWHAAGYGEKDENPERMEHFGITTVEAMSAGCVPLVINKGGQPEIVTTYEGVLWNTIDELVDATTKVCTNLDLRSLYSRASIERAKSFDISHFEESLTRILNEEK